MTVLNSKEKAVKYNPSEHYRPTDPPLKGKTWKVNRELSGERIVKDVEPCDVLVCPEQNNGLFLSRLKKDYDLAVWVSD